MTTLVVNSIVDPRTRARFTDVVIPRIAPADTSVVHLLESGQLPGAAGFSHLLLTGSELSAAESNERDDDLLGLIRAFLDAGRPVLGICYGHQMLARAILGPQACRRASAPEFGWRRLTLGPNPLFADVDDLISLHSHYDEVCNLTDEFTVIASTPGCAVQGFQYGDRPVWGVQFHPELNHEEGSRLLARNLETEPLAPDHYLDEIVDPAQVEENDKLFRNFFGAEVRCS